MAMESHKKVKDGYGVKMQMDNSVSAIMSLEHSHFHWSPCLEILWMNLLLEKDTRLDWFKIHMQKNQNLELAKLWISLLFLLKINQDQINLWSLRFHRLALLKWRKNPIKNLQVSQRLKLSDKIFIEIIDYRVTHQPNIKIVQNLLYKKNQAQSLQSQDTLCHRLRISGKNLFQIVSKRRQLPKNRSVQ